MAITTLTQGGILLFFESIIFFVVFAAVWYFFETKNILGFGKKRSTKKGAAKYSIIMSAIATVIYTVIGYYL